MIDAKPWYLSRTVWAAVVAIASSLGGLLGVTDSAIDAGELTDAILQTVTAAAGLVALLGRLRATDRLR